MVFENKIGILVKQDLWINLSLIIIAIESWRYFLSGRTAQVIFCEWQIAHVCRWWECVAIEVVDKSIFSTEINIAEGKRIVGVD